MVSTKFLKSHKTLVLDDDVSFLILIELLVQDDSVARCSEPEKALDILKSGKFTALVTDTNMPNMSGIDVLLQVRHDPELKDLPVIVLFSGLNGSDITVRDVYEAGATLVMSKPEFITKLNGD